MKEFQPIQRLKEFIHYRRNVKALPKGDSLCFPGETTGHDQSPYKDGKGTELEQFPQAKIVFDGSSAFDRANEDRD